MKKLWTVILLLVCTCIALSFQMVNNTERAPLTSQADRPWIDHNGEILVLPAGVNTDLKRSLVFLKATFQDLHWYLQHIEYDNQLYYRLYPHLKPDHMDALEIHADWLKESYEASIRGFDVLIDSLP